MAHKLTGSPMWSVHHCCFPTATSGTEQFSHTLSTILTTSKQSMSRMSLGSWSLRKRSVSKVKPVIHSDNLQSTFRTLALGNLHQSSRAGNGLILTVSVLWRFGTRPLKEPDPGKRLPRHLHSLLPAPPLKLSWSRQHTFTNICSYGF